MRVFSRLKWTISAGLTSSRRDSMGKTSTQQHIHVHVDNNYSSIVMFIPSTIHDSQHCQKGHFSDDNDDAEYIHKHTV